MAKELRPTPQKNKGYSVQINRHGEISVFSLLNQPGWRRSRKNHLYVGNLYDFRR